MDALSNLHSIRADVIEVWGPVALQYKTIQETIVGLPPSTLNNLELIAAAIGNDPGYFETVAEGLDAKAESSFVESEIDRLDTDIATKASTADVNTASGLRDAEIALLNTGLASKASTSDVDTASGLRDAEIALLNTGLASKASTADVDTASGLRDAEIDRLDTELASKVESTLMDSEFAGVARHLG